MRMHRLLFKNTKRAGLITLALFAFFPLLYVHANVGLSIQPVKVSHTLRPGEVVSGEISLINTSDTDVVVETKVEDFIPDSGTSGVQFVGRAPGGTTVRDWIFLGGQKFITFKKGESRSVPYTITVPKNAEPGSHFGVAFFKALPAGVSGDQLRVGTQLGMLIFVTVPGNFKQTGVINSFAPVSSFYQSGSIEFNIAFQNTGTVHFEPKGTILIKNIFGSEVAKIPVEGQVVLPTGVRNIKALWIPTSLLLGRYTASLVLFDGAGKEISAAPTAVYGFPVFWTLCFVVIFFVFYFGLRFLRKKISFSVSLKK